MAIRTESQEPASWPELLRDLVDELTPSLNTLGFECRVFDNPDPRGGPLLVARRFEGEGPTLLSYGHGDVVREDRKLKRPFSDRGRPGTGLDALGAATGVDSGLVSDGGPGRKGLSVRSSTGQPGRSGRFGPSRRAPDATGPGPGAPSRLTAKLEPRSGRVEQRLPTRRSAWWCASL